MKLEKLEKLFNKQKDKKLIRLLSYKKEYWVREHAAGYLEKLSSRQAVEPLIKALWDGNSSVRAAAAKALGEIKDPRAVEPLIKALAEETWWGVRIEISRALGELKDLRAVEPLIREFYGGYAQIPNGFSDTVRAAAAKALGRLKDLRALEPLIQALSNTYNHELYNEAVGALGEIEDPQAVEALIKALSESSCSVCEVATALGRHKDPRAIKPLITALCRPASLHGSFLYDYGAERVVIAKVLGELGEPKWEKCIQGYHSDFERILELNDPRVNKEVVKAGVAAVENSGARGGDRGGVYDSRFD